MEPFFSFVIPTLNEEEYLPLLLSDLKNQKEKDFEVIIADGKSEDRTRERALEFSQFFRLSFFENAKKNVAFQRNYGAEKAKGKYIVFLDADTHILPSFTKILKRIILGKKGLVFLPYNLPDEKNPQAQLMYRFVNFLVELSQSTAKPFSTVGMIFERNFFLTMGGFDESVFLAEDHKIIQDSHKWGVRAKFLNQVKVTFSLRRMKREGQWSMLYKYLLATAHILLKGDIKSHIFEYNMGGSVGKTLKKHMPIVQDLKTYLNQLKKFFEER